MHRRAMLLNIDKLEVWAHASFAGNAVDKRQDYYVTNKVNEK